MTKWDLCGRAWSLCLADGNVELGNVQARLLQLGALELQGDVT